MRRQKTFIFIDHAWTWISAMREIYQVYHIEIREVGKNVDYQVKVRYKEK